MEFKIYSYSDATNNSAFELIDKITDDFNDAVNTSDEYSLIYDFNHNAKVGEAFEVNQLFYEMLELSEEYYEVTDGYFNVGILPLVKLWGVNKEDLTDASIPIPTQEQVDATLAYSDFMRDFSFYTEDNKYYVKKLTDDRSMLDFGGMAKGFMCDKMSEAAFNAGVVCGFFDVSGNVLTLDINRLAKREWWFAIGTPDYFFTQGEKIATIQLNSQSLVTSGDYQRYKFVDNAQVCHIINAKTGMPVGVYRTENGLTNINPNTGVVDHVTSVSIVDSNSARAEFFSTYVMALASDAENNIGLAEASEILSKQSVQAVILTHSSEAVIIGDIASISTVGVNGLSYYTIPEELAKYGRLS